MLRFGERKGHQFAHLGELQSPLAVATLMEADPVGESRVQSFYFQYIRQKLDKLVNLFRDGGVPVQMILDMQYAAARGGDDIIELTEVFYKKVFAAFGQMPEP